MERHDLGTGDGDGLDPRSDPPPLEETRDLLEVAEAAVGAGTEEGDVDPRALDRRTGAELHVGERLLDGGALVDRLGLRRIRYALVDRDTLPGIDAPGDGRGDGRGVNRDDIVVMAPRIAREGFPADHGLLPCSAGRRVRPALEVGKGGLVRVDVTRAGAALDGHIAHGHALLHRETVEDLAAVLVGETGTAIDPEHADDVEDDVLGVDARPQASVDVDAADLEATQRHGLRGEHVADLGGADAEGDGAERPVGAGVRVTAGDRGARLGDALLGTDDVHDALLAGGAVEERDAELRAIAAQLVHHRLRERVAVGLDQLVGGHDVVDRGERAVRHRDLQAEVAEHAESLRAGDLVDEVGADQELGLAVGERADGVGVPDFFEEGLGRGHDGDRILPSACHNRKYSFSPR